MDLNKRILVGDVLEKLSEIPDESIDCVVTSPPYWGLRDYGVEGQMGNEKSFHEYLGKLDSMMVELKRIIKQTGSVWINLGDTYNGTGDHTYELSDKEIQWISGPKKMKLDSEPRKTKGHFIKNIGRKSRYGIPERFYINCIDSGWTARNHIIWQKPNAMPSSVKDRLSSKFESIFFFVKSRKYYFDLEAIRIPMKTVFVKTGTKIRETVPKTNRKQDNVRRGDGKLDMTKVGFNDRYKRKHQLGTNYGNAEEKIQHDRDAGKDHDLGLSKLDGKKNPGDVWKQRRDMQYDDSKPYAVLERKGVIYFRDLPDLKDIRDYLNLWKKEKNITIDQIEEHFGNYTPHHWFDKDGSYPTREDWIKVKKFLDFDDKYDERMLTEYAKPAEKMNHPDGKNPGDVWEINTKPFPEAHFATFPPELPRRVIKCACPKDGIVLDPFMGSGTTAMVAEELGRKWIGIELNGEYVNIINRRLENKK